jgi:hypothetical protein
MPPVRTNSGTPASPQAPTTSPTSTVVTTSTSAPGISANSITVATRLITRSAVDVLQNPPPPPALRRE